jgi:deoxyadenosine/deoxycytidine kinase
VRFVSIEGNIGAGKSTLLNHIRGYIEEYELNKDNHIIFLREPVDIWQNMKDTEGKNILELLYENPHKYAFEFQLTAYSTQIKLIDEVLENNPQCTLIISERCFEAGHNVFTKMLCDEGCISSIQYEIYKGLLETRTNTRQLIHTGVPDKILYLDLLPETCNKRICKRGREEETPITLDYLKKCDEYYKNWLNKNSNKVVYIDLNETTDDSLGSSSYANIVFVIEQILSS